MAGSSRSRLSVGRPTLALALALVLALVVIPAGAGAQQGPPYTLEQVERYLNARTSPELLLGWVQRDCRAFVMDEETEGRLRSAGAPEAFLEGLRGACYRGPEPEEVPVRVEPAMEPEVQREPRGREPGPPGIYSPGSAAVRSLVLPGLGQFSTGRPVVGAVFLAGWAGALGLGLMTQEVTVECLDRVTDSCPSNRVLAETVKRPMLAVGVGGAVALAVVSALEARSGAKKLNARGVAMGEGEGRDGIRVVALPSEPVRSAREVILVQVRF